MKTVSREQMIQTWERLCDLDEEQSAAMSKKFLEEQPALGVYLVASTETMGKEAEPSPIIELAMAVWEVMSQAADKPLKLVSPEALESAEEANTGMLEGLADASEFQFHDAAAGLVTSFNQREILAFCIEVLMKDDADQPELAPERVGMELLVLKTIIDCLDR
jgi:hypothetical protein